MKFIIDQRIVQEYPGIAIGIVVAHGVNNKQSNVRIMDLLEQQHIQVAERMNLEMLQTSPYITAWHEAYKKFGAKPKKHLPSIENLLQRILRGKELGSINPLVDLYNLISLKYLLPAGGEDLATIKGNIALKIAGDNEPAVVLLGESEARSPEAGEVIYADDNGAICRRWNWKEAERTKLTPDTTDAVLVLELLPPIPRTYLEAAVNDLAFLIEQFCGGSTSVSILDEKKNVVELGNPGSYVALNSKQKLDFTQTPWQEIKISSVHELENLAAHSAEHRIRMQKVETMREQGIDPWPSFKPVNATCKDVIDEFDSAKESRQYELAGRVMIKREHGKAMFIVIQDQTSRIQMYIRQDEIGEKDFAFIKDFIDLGDIIWCKGHSFLTKTQEITIKVIQIQLMSKCLYPLPDKFHGLTDVEQKYRQRYLDLISNAESRERFIKRSHIERIMRNFFDSYNFLEVETPMLHQIPGGAAAKPFVTHHNALGMNLYLRIAPELYLKRLVIGGFERVYEINRNFRNEGISTRHNPEFTMVEWYIAHHDYVWMMDFTEKLIRHIAQEITGSTTVTYGEHTINFGIPFRRMSMYDAVKEYTHCSDKDLSEGGIDALLAHHKVHIAQKNASWGQKLYALFEACVEAHLVQPTFITQFPVEVSPLAKRNKQNQAFVDRYELFMANMELSNSFNELNDPFDQAERFKEQVVARDAGDQEAHYYDADYILALEYGLPPTAGAGLGIDRLVMILTNTQSIRDVILFPTLKKK